jgi:sialate O-acetylesterase
MFAAKLRKEISMRQTLWLFWSATLTLMVLASGPARGASKELPRGENVVDLPAISDGLCVQALFQSNMVLQRNKPISIWGWAAPGETVTVTFDHKHQSATAGPERVWKVTFPAMPESAHDFSAIGYVFARRLYMATQVPIGMIDVSRGGTCLETWMPTALLKSINTPEVRDIITGWDTQIKEYDPKTDLLRRIQQLHARIKAGKVAPNTKDPTDLLPGPVADMNRPGNCYGGMLGPMIGLQIKGVIWHQGYNNALGNATTGGVMYHQLFARMIESWRMAFNNPDMAFGIISLCTDGQPQSLDHFMTGLADNGCYIREAQFKTFAEMRNAGDKNIGFASSDDQRRNWFHPQIKIPVGERIARWALATQYGLGVRWLPPMVTEMKVEDGKITLQLDSSARPFHDGPILGFAIAGSDRKFYPADAVNGKNASVVVLSSPFVLHPVAYRCAWHRNPMANLKSDDHTELPMPIERSDDWSMNDLYEAYVGKKSRSPAVLDDNERRAFITALNAADMDRRLHEAQAFIKEHQAGGER